MWVVDDEDRLRRLALDIAWTDADAVYVRSEILPANWRGKTLRVVRRPISGALEGMNVVPDSDSKTPTKVADKGSQTDEQTGETEVDHG